MIKIVYVQKNEEIATLFQEKFLKNEIEMIHAKSGEEALEIITREKVLLLLIDINLPDMRLRKFIDRLRAISPQVILNVCVDVLDPLMITKLSNRHHIHKIYVAPWDIDNIVEELKESLEIAIISEQANVKEENLIVEKEEFENTLNSLKETLKKQQHSYSKFLTLTDCFTDALADKTLEDDEFKDRLIFARDLYSAMLKMQTTGSFDIDRFEESIRADLEGLKKTFKLISVGEISSCLFGGQSRPSAQNIRFSIYMLARLYAQFYRDFVLDVSSHYLTTREAEFCIKITLRNDRCSASQETMKRYSKYIDEIVSSMTSSHRESIEENEVSHFCTFTV